MNANHAALPAYPCLTERLIADVAVIGGGMAGILTAYTLHTAGLRVVLLEENRLASGASGRTCARLSAQHGLFCERLLRDFGERLARQYVMAQLHAVKQYRDLIASLEIPCSLTDQTSHVCAAHDSLSREFAAALLLGAPAELCTAEGLPFPARETLCFTGQASLEPLPLLAALLPGLSVFEHSPVRKIRGHTVYCDEGSVKASEIVVATRYPMLEHPGLYPLRLRQEQAYLLALAGAPRLDGWYLDAGEENVCLQQHGDTLLLAGGLHRCGDSSGHSYERLRETAAKWFPLAREIGAWSQQDCASLDGVPYIGRYSEALPHLHVAAGFGRWGLTNSMVAATLLTAEILGNCYPYADVFSPERFHPSASAESILAGAYYAIRGKKRRFFTPAQREAGAVKPGCAAIVRRGLRLYGAYRSESGAWYAVSPVCPHRGCALEWNADEKTWDCPCHGSRFDYTGERLSHPARTALSRFDPSVL